MTFYLLWASQGEYSDRSEWPVALYDDEDPCRAAVRRGEALHRLLKPREYVSYEDREKLLDNAEGRELTAILGQEPDFWDDLILTCCEIEFRTASGMEAATAGETPKSGSTVGDSPVPEGQTPNLSKDLSHDQ